MAGELDGYVAGMACSACELSSHLTIQLLSHGTRGTISFMSAATIAKISFFAVMFLGVSFEVAGDYFFKKWSLTDRYAVLGIGLAMYFIGTVFWAFSLKYETLSRAITFFMVLSLLMAVGVGVIFFHEELSLANKAGIGLGIASLLLLELF